MYLIFPAHCYDVITTQLVYFCVIIMKFIIVEKEFIVEAKEER